MLDGSTEKAVTIAGSVAQISTAVARINQILASCVDVTLRSPPVFYVPSSVSPMPQLPVPALGINTTPVMPSPRYGTPAQYSGPMHHSTPFNPYNSGAAAGFIAPSGPPMSSAQVALPIADFMVGRLVGKGGVTIREFRLRSGADIQMREPQPGRTERLLTVTGSPRQVEYGVQLVYQKIAEISQRVPVVQRQTVLDASPAPAQS